ADGVIDELELAQAAEIGYGEDAFENALQTRVVALLRQQFHLQEALIGFLLNLDQIGDRDRSLDLRKIVSLAGAIFRGMHYSVLRVQSGKGAAVKKARRG